MWHLEELKRINKRTQAKCTHHRLTKHCPLCEVREAPPGYLLCLKCCLYHAAGVTCGD